MKTEFYNKTDSQVLEYCGKIIRGGGLVCFPTETVYGLGADAFNPKAVKSVYEAKGRPHDNPLIVHISDLKDINEITAMTQIERDRFGKMADAFWPGPLTMIVTKGNSIPEEVSCGLKTVGVRFPSHPVAQAFIKAAKRPIAAPSANSSGRPSPTLASHVQEDLTGKVDAIIDGGPCQVGLESTVIDLTGEVPCILRPGGITLEMIRKVLPDATQLGWHEEEIKKDKEPPKSPGLKYKHYAPKAKTVILQGEPEKIAEHIKWALKNADKRGVKAAAMVADETKEYFTQGENAVALGSRNDGKAQAAALFRVLRSFDEDGVAEVYAEAMPETGVGFAVMNRMYRAAGCTMVPVKHIMFVCTGNTCRSFMAEYIYRSMLEKRMGKGDISACAIKVSSAGVFATDGSAGTVMAEEVLKCEYDIDGTNHRARLLTYDMAHEADIILTMTEGHKLAILRCFPELASKVFTLAEYAGGQDVQDPFAGSYMTYSRCAEQIKNLIERAGL